MKKTILSILFCVVALAVSAQAQGYRGSGRLRDAADRLATQASDLSNRLYNDFRSRNFNSRSDLDALFLAQQLDSSARLFQQMVQDNRRDSELRDAAAILSDLSRRAPGYGSNSYQWRDVQTSITDIQRLATGGYGTGGGYGNDNGGYVPPGNDGRVTGRVTWSGTVDNEVQLTVRGDNIETRTISGNEFRNENFNFTSPLPNRGVNVQVNKKRGRGEVRVIQQPSRTNNYTAVIQILDKKGSNDRYELDIYWY